MSKTATPMEQFLSFVEETKKKRKEEKENTSSAMDEFLAFVDNMRQEKEGKTPNKSAGTTALSQMEDLLGGTAKSTLGLNDGIKSEFDAYQKNKMGEELANLIETQNKKAKEDEGWFKSGLFADGWDPLDLTGTILGTAGDVLTNVFKGAGNLGEGVTDLIMYGVSEGADLVGADSFADDVKNLAKKNTVNDAFSGMEEMFNETSVLGNKADAVSQGLGQIGAFWATSGLASLGTLGTTLLTGASSWGSGMSEAYQSGEDVSDKDAWTYGFSKGVVDAGSELIFGGLGKSINALGFNRGISSLDDMFAKKLSSKISNQFAKSCVQFGVKASAEGLEEVLAGLGTAAAKKLTYMSDEDLGKLIADENLLDQFVVGMVTSSIAQSGLVPGMSQGSLKESITTGKDFITGMTQNEQAVVDKVFENEVKQQEESGKKLTKSEKNKLYYEVLTELEKGGISTDVIEEVLGGETYKAYKDTVDGENALAEQEKTLQDEYGQLNKKFWRDMTGEELDRREELKDQLKDIRAKIETNKNNSSRSQLKDQLSREVSELVKNDRLSESYAEKGRRGQKFTADLTQYTPEQRKIVQKAIDSGILNNTNRAHEFVDLVAKVAADKGVDFDFTDNKRLRESGFALKDATVNGFLNENGVTINLNSAKALNSVVGHEITHVLEGTELYDALAKSITEYAKSKGEYDARLKALTELYKGREGYTGEDADAKIQQEVVADLVGDYLFTDSDFIGRLSAENRGLFQKIFDEVKYLCKVATAGSKEARQLEKVKKAFENAYRTETKNPTEDGGVKYSLVGRTADGLGIYKTNYPPNTPKSVKQADLISLVQNVWSNEPITLKMVEDGEYKDIIAKFNPELESRSDLAKIAFGNRKGTAAEQRMTLDLASDLYQIATEAKYNYSKDAIPKPNNPAHDGVTKYHYFLTNLVYKSYDGEYIPCHMNIDVKKNADGEWFYSFAIEKGSAPQTLLAAVTEDSATLPTDMIDEFAQNVNTKNSLSSANDVTQPVRGGIYGKDVLLEGLDAMAEDADTESQYAEPFHSEEDLMDAELREMDDAYRVQAEGEGYASSLYDSGEGSGVDTVAQRLEVKKQNAQWELEASQKSRQAAMEAYDEKIASLQAKYDAKPNKHTKAAEKLQRQIQRMQRMKADRLGEYDKRINDIQSRIEKITGELNKDHSKQDKLEMAYSRIDRRLEADVADLTAEFDQRRQELTEQIGNKTKYVKDRALALHQELQNLRKGVRASTQLGYLKDAGFGWSEIRQALAAVSQSPTMPIQKDSAAESAARETLLREYEDRIAELDDLDNQYQQEVKALEAEAEKEKQAATVAHQRVVRKELHQGIVEKVKDKFSEKGLDLDKVLEKARDLSTFATVDNTPQRVMEKALGYKEGQILSDMTVNQVAQNETEGIKWLNSFTDRKNGLLAQISKQYGIKPGSKESAAAQMYAEGFYVDENNNIVQYGDAELAKDFPDATVQKNIKGLARDQRIRQIYDDTLATINKSRKRNGYPEIPKLDNYFLHFRAMEDTFSRLGLPFNPNDIRAKDLPTDLNGVTADLKPGQPYFASAMHRTGKRTSFDLLGGLEKYLTSAKNQIYHIDDIQTLRALRNYIADTYGQANGLEGLDALTEEEAQERIEKVYNSHLSTFAKFLNEEANILAGKTALIDRGLEGIIGRRGITFLNNVNKQVGSNMVGYNISSSLTNFLPVAQTFAKTNKADFVKAFAQTVSNKVGSVFGRSDGFTENSSVVIRRKGADRFHRTLWQKLGDPGYALMGAVDNISTELIARTKYNELTRKGMDSKQAHYETDKWVSRLMGDRSLGQQPQLYNSKMLGLFTKFQLEVRNQLDSQFYDTIKEAETSAEDIQNGLARNAKKAAKITSTFAQLAVVQHLFGMAFESVAGYNPAFDIIEVITKACGWDDDEDSEDTVLDNIEQGFFALLEDLPYTSTFTGGRIPIESALPIEQLIMGEDEYGNEKSRLETLAEIAPYYVLPGGYGQLKKTGQGLSMFDDDLPVSGSYTPDGALRFPVEDDLGSILKAGIFGQWASENAQQYIEEGRQPLGDKLLQEFIDSNMTIQDYWDYRDGLKGLSTLDEKADYIGGLDLTTEQKNLLINNIAGRNEPIDMTDYEDYSDFEEMDFAIQNPEKYAFLQKQGVSFSEYKSFDADTKEAYSWAANNPAKFAVSQAVTNDFVKYRKYTKDLNNIAGDKDANGNTVSGSKKKKVAAYINGLNLEYGEKIILFKSQYPSDDTYNYEIIDYLNSRSDISYQQMKTILEELGFKVDSKGNITWD